MVNKLSSFAQKVLAYDRFLIVGHENPDPDSLGSMLALDSWLRARGKTTWMMSGDPLPNYEWPNIHRIKPPHKVEFENAIVLDCEPQRTGKLYSMVQQAKVVFNIDHHESNKGNCDYNYIDAHEAAACMIIYKMLKSLEADLSFELAQPLYAGILGDTGGFRYPNTDSQVLAAAADLVRHGALPDKTAREIFESKPLSFIRFIGYALNKLGTSANDQLVWIALSHDDFVNYGVSPQLSDELINYARMVQGGEIIILFREVAPNVVRIGFRSHRINIYKLAASFGGGGHLLAAGAQIEGTLPEIVTEVLGAAAKLLDGEGNEWNY